MSGYIAFLKKEFTENIKNYRFLILFAVFLAFGIMSAFLAKFTPEILSTLAADMQMTSEPVALDAWKQFYKNISGVGFSAFIILFGSCLSNEYSKGTLVLMVTKGLSRKAVILAKYTVAATLMTFSYWITDSNLNHTGIYLYSKGKIMIHLTFDYKTDEKCTTPGQYLKYHRTFQGLSTRELAEKVGIVPATLVLYENDRHPIKHSTAVALANALGIDRNRLLDKYTAFVDYPYSSLLKKVRQDLSLTQIQMAELIGIGQTSYSGWEREIRVPRRKEYDKILAALEKLRVNVDTYLCQSASI